MIMVKLLVWKIQKLLESLPSKIRDAMGIVVDINLVPIYICVSNTKTV